MNRHLALLVLLPGVAACGGASSPTAAPPLPEAAAAFAPAPPAVLSFVSGETQMPVPSAVVHVDGRSYTTDEQGRVRLEAPASPQSSLDVEASAFFLRRTLLRADRFTLWPTQSPTGLDQEYTARIVYNCGSGCDTGGEPLLRVVGGVVHLLPSTELRASASAMESLREAADLISAATRGTVRFSVTEAPPAASVVVSARVDGHDPALVSLNAAAVTRRFLGPSGEIVEASITFRTLSLARRTPLVLHELGHAFGLGHSPRSGDVMWAGPELYDTADFSPREKLAVDLMLQRLPRNRFPDSDEEAMAGTRSGAPASALVACPPP